MKNILSIFSLSLVILIGYSEESISQVNEVTQATQSNEADVKEFITTIATIAFSNPVKLYSYSDYFLYSKVYNGRIEGIQEILFEQANAEGTDRVNFLISGLRNYYKGCNFFVSAQQCANDSNAVIDDQMILQNVENNIDRLSPPCIRHTSELLETLFIRGLVVDVDKQMTPIQKQHALRDMIDDFSTGIEEEMNRCQADHSDTADEANR